MSGMSRRAKGVGALIASAFGFGVIAIATRHLGAYFTLWQQLYLSIGIAFLVSIIIFPRTLTAERLRGIPPRDWIIIPLRVIGSYAIAAALFRQALIITKIGNVEFIQSIPFEAVFGWLLFKEKFTFKKFFWLLIAFLGVILISVQDFASLFEVGRGEMFSLVSAALFSLSFLSRKWQSDYLTNREITQIVLCMGMAMLFSISMLQGEPLPGISHDWIVITALFLAGLFNTINVFLINYGFEHVKGVLASNLLALEAIFALFLAFIFYREFPDAKECIGGMLILCSVFKMNRLSET